MDDLTIDQYKILILERLKKVGASNPNNLGIEDLSKDLGYDICVMLAKDRLVDMGKTMVVIKPAGSDFLDLHYSGIELMHQFERVVDERINLKKPVSTNLQTQVKIPNAHKKHRLAFIKDISATQWQVLIALMLLAITIWQVFK